MNLTFLSSKVTWGVVALFVIGGCEQVGWLPVGIGDSVIALLGIGTLVTHNSQITAGSVK
jgi:hypothetical protein